MTANLPKKGIIAEATNYGEVKLPPKAERVYGKPTKSDCTAMYLDRDGRVQTVHYRMPAAKKLKDKGATVSTNLRTMSAWCRSRVLT
jgi:ParB family chromosome partitioning protein